MHSHIANTGRWSKANDAQKYKRKHLMARQKEIKRKVDALVNAVAEGVNNPSITERLTELEAERQHVTSELRVTEVEIAKATVLRPTAEQVQAEWNRFLERLENLTKPEKRLALQAMIEEVRVVSKNEITLRVSASAGSLDGLLASEGQLGAGHRLSSIYPPEPLAFETVSFRFKALKGGRCRTKIPRHKETLS